MPLKVLKASLTNDVIKLDASSLLAMESGGVDLVSRADISITLAVFAVLELTGANSTKFWPRLAVFIYLRLILCL